MSLFKKPFKDFPPIPEIPFWTDGFDGINISEPKKVMHNDKIGSDEERQLEIAIKFYQELIDKIKQTDLTQFTEEEFEDFKKYYDNAFAHASFVLNDLHVASMVRLVKNKDVQGNTDKIRERKYLTYPTRSVVKKYNIYNRANTPNFNLFYASLSIDSVLNELRPETGEIVSVGIWKANRGIKKLNSFPITHNADAVKVNSDAKKGFLAFEKLKTERHPLFVKLMEVIFDHLGYEFSKTVSDDKRNYYFSARFSERLLELDVDRNFDFDCMVYPSVRNKLIVDNLAILPSVIDDHFKLSKVIQFEIGETFYDVREPDRENQEGISLVTPVNQVETDWIEDNGYIVWA